MRVNEKALRRTVRPASWINSAPHPSLFWFLAGPRLYLEFGVHVRAGPAP
jgi:hypothetical protein